jgi:hypothetical protein
MPERLSASSSNAEMRAYYVDPGSSKYQVGKVVAIDVAKMKVYKSIDYPEHRNLSGINKAGETAATRTYLLCVL